MLCYIMGWPDEDFVRFLMLEHSMKFICNQNQFVNVFLSFCKKLVKLYNAVARSIEN